MFQAVHPCLALGLDHSPRCSFTQWGSAHAGRMCVCGWDCCRVPWPLQHTGYSNVTCGPLLASCSIAASSFLCLTLPILFPSCVVFFPVQTEFQFTCSSYFSQSQGCESVVTGFTIPGWRELTARFCMHTYEPETIFEYLQRFPPCCPKCHFQNLEKGAEGGRSWQEIHLNKASHARHCVLL